jgi:hypothetical protein
MNTSGSEFRSQYNKVNAENCRSQCCASNDKASKILLDETGTEVNVELY